MPTYFCIPVNLFLVAFMFSLSPDASASMKTLPINLDAFSLSPDAPDIRGVTSRWDILASLPVAAKTAGFQISIETPKGSNLLTWEVAARDVVRLLHWGNGLYFEADGEIHRFTWLDNSSIKSIAFRWTPSADIQDEPRIQIDKALFPEANSATLSRQVPIERHIFTLPLNWMNRSSYRPISSVEYDLPIAPLDVDLTWDLQKMYENGVTVVTLDNLATKRPSEVMPFYTQFFRWKRAIDDFERQGRGRMWYVPFWEFNVVGAQSTSEKEQSETAAYIADILGFFDARNAGDPAFLKIQERPFHFVYNSMYYARPPFWQKVTDRFSGAGRYPILSLGVGGIPMTVQGKFSSDEMAPFTDELFESVFVFQLWSPRADSLPQNIARHLSAHGDARHFVGPSSPGYWSVRREMQSYVDFRFTQRLRETLDASLRAKADGIHLTTWDDWQETNNFAPSFNNLTSRLEIVQALTAAWRKSEAAIPTDTPRVIVSYKKTWRTGEPLGIEVLALPSSGFSTPFIVTLNILDNAGVSIARLVTPPLDPAKNQDHLITLPTSALASFDTAAPGLLSIEATIHDIASGREFISGQLPQIPILPNSFFDTDLTYYSIPLHRLAGRDRPAIFCVGEGDGGAVSYRIETSELSQRKDDNITFRWAATRNGHPLRFMAPADKSGAEVSLGRAGGRWKLSPHDPHRPFLDTLPPLALPYPAGKPSLEPTMQPYVGKGAGPLRSGGDNHYTALVEYPDGKYAYTKTVWVRADRPASSSLSARWVMTLDQHGHVSDLGSAGNNLLIEPSGERRFTTLPEGKLPVLEFVGNKGVPLPLNIIPGGPATVECAFTFRQTGRPMNIFSQIGCAQLELSLDSSGKLLLTRSDFDKNPVRITSPEPLVADRLFAVAGVYTGSELRLYINGERVAKTPLTGSRTNEGVLFGGSANAPFSGSIHQIAIHGGALAEEVLQRNAQATLR